MHINLVVFIYQVSWQVVGRFDQSKTEERACFSAGNVQEEEMGRMVKEY